jgi:hypothetical protein
MTLPKVSKNILGHDNNYIGIDPITTEVGDIAIGVIHVGFFL